MPNKKHNSLLQYAGIATQLLIGLGLITYIGKVQLTNDILTITGIKFGSTPLFIWILPLLLLVGMLLKAIKDTNKKQQ